jgi:hypothetical protein
MSRCSVQSRILPLVIALLPACGGIEAGPDPDADILEQLAALPGVTVVEWTPPVELAREHGYRYFDLWFTQPVDHGDATSPGFQQYAALMHRDVAAPFVVHTSGYGASWTRTLTEPAAIVDGNQLSLEYRFYAGSRPDEIPWSHLRSAQATADQHEVLDLLDDIYGGSVLSTGGSKGGEHALFHHADYPGDVDAVIAYVAPVLTDLPDERYAGVLDAIGTPECRKRLRDVQRVMLEQRDALAERAELEADFTVAGVDHAVETAVVELEFAFWMTRGEADCVWVPAADASPAVLYDFLASTSWPGAYGDEDLADYGNQYLYQDMAELGYPVLDHAHLDDLLRYTYEDWSAYLPPGVPIAFDPSAPRALADWLATDAERVLLIYGEWDPWSPGAATVAPGRDSHVYWVPHGSHWSSRIMTLPDDDFDEATATLRRWAGVPENQPGRPPRERRNEKNSRRVLGP